MTVATSPRLAEIIVEWFAEREWTEEEYLRFANERNAIVELVDGKVVLQEMPAPGHQAVVVKLILALGRSAQGKVFVAPMPVRLRQRNMREPDVAFFLHHHLDRIHDQFTDPPDLAVEVLSPSTQSIDLDDKHSEYAQAGIPEYWIVDLKARTIAVHTLIPAEHRYAAPTRYGASETIQPLAAPDIVVTVDDVFAQ